MSNFSKPDGAGCQAAVLDAETTTKTDVAEGGKNKTATTEDDCAPRKGVRTRVTLNRRNYSGDQRS